MNSTFLRKETASLLQYLPDEELTTVNQLIKMLIRSWDPDFTKVTEEEEKRLDAAERQMENGEYYTDDVFLASQK